MAIDSNRAHSDLPVPPGDVLDEELAARGMTQKELSARMGRPYQALNEIVNAKKSITPDTAIQLGAILGQDPQYWLNLESEYQMVLARNREAVRLQSNQQWLDHFPVSEMVKRGWIDAGRDRESRLKALLEFLGSADAEPDNYQQAVGFGLDSKGKKDLPLGSMCVWLRKGELAAQEAKVAKFDEVAFRDALDDIRLLLELPPEDFLPRIELACAGAGVVFRLIEAFPKCNVIGATSWVSEKRVLMQMSFREKWADSFWFSFFHQAGHILFHKAHRRFVIDFARTYASTEIFESEADAFAWEFLIPGKRWESFCQDGRFAQEDIYEFAQAIDVSPFMVIGRLHREKQILWKTHRAFKPRYVWRDRFASPIEEESFSIKQSPPPSGWIGDVFPESEPRLTNLEV